MPDKYLPLPFPLAGVDITNEENQQRPNTAAVGVNVRGRDPIHRRMRGGSRPGLSRYVDAQVSGANLIQHLNTITTINEDALPANQWNADWERFYFDDPSTPSEFGWTYIGSVDAPIDPYWIPDPSDNLPAFRGKDKRPLPPGCTLHPPVVNPKKVRPIIGWDTPADIEFPTPLSATQLSPTAKHPQTGELVPGTFAFFPPKGTVLAVGASRPLRTIFTPTNLAKFFPAKKEVAINVVAYAGGYTPYSGYSYPDTLNVLFEWPLEADGTTPIGETYSYRTTAAFDGAGTWTVAGLPHTLADLSYGNDDGKITILSQATGLFTPPNTLTAGTAFRIRVVSPTAITIDFSARFGVGQYVGNSGYYEVSLDATGLTPPPAQISLSNLINVIIADGTSGATRTGYFKITVTGP